MATVPDNLWNDEGGQGKREGGGAQSEIQID